MRIPVCWHLLLPVLVVLGGASNAAGQAARPVDEAWTGVVNGLAAVISHKDADALRVVLGEASLHRLDGTGTDVRSLFTQSGRSSILLARAYPQLPLTLASDIADAIKESDLPQAIKQHMAVGDETDAERANDTASRWAAKALSAGPADLVGLVLLSDKPQQGKTGTRSLMFVLVKGELSASGVAHVRAVAFGRPALDR